MREIENDGFITRESDLIRSMPVEYKPNFDGQYTGTPMRECDYPKCESCRKYTAGYCTVPMVVTKQAYLEVSERLEVYENRLSELEEMVIYALYGIPHSKDEPDNDTAEQFKNITWDEVEA